MFRRKVLQLFLSKQFNNNSNKCWKRNRSISVNPREEKSNFIIRQPKDIVIPNATLPEIIWDGIDGWAEKTALVCSETGRSYTYAELYEKSKNFAKALRARLRLRPRDTIAILLPNVPEYTIVMLGSIEANLVVTTINPIYTSEEIARQLIDSVAEAIITTDSSYKKVLDAFNCTKKKIPVITVKTKQGEPTPNNAINLTELCEMNIDFPLEPGNPNDVVVMPYSSGTTGLPKGVELTHMNLVSNIYQTSVIDSAFGLTTKENQDIVTGLLPFFHIYGMVVNNLKMLQRGFKIISMPKFTPDSYIEMLKTHKPQHLFVVPPIVIFMAAHSDVKSECLDCVKLLMSGAAPLANTDLERFHHKAKRDVLTLQGYGMTETSPVVATTAIDNWKDTIGSTGQVLPNTDLKIIALDDPTGSPLGPNQPGEILLKGPQVMKQYHNNPKATEDVFLDGWLRTGDMAYYDDQRNIWITDRLKELIKVKGFQVAPAELEAIVRDHPQVADTAIIGIPHPISGEVPRAFVVRQSNADVSEEEIQNYVAERVAAYKKLEGGVIFVDAIPKNASGKIMRRTLKTEYANN